MQKSWIAILLVASSFINISYAVISHPLDAYSIQVSKTVKVLDITNLLRQRHLAVRVRNPATNMLGATQDGVFIQDVDGYFSQKGNRLQGYPLKPTPSAVFILSDVKAPADKLSAKATTTLFDVINFNSADSSPVVPFSPTDPHSFNYVINQIIYDSRGATHQFAAYSVKLPTGLWNVYASVDGVLMGVGTLQFGSGHELISQTGLTNLIFNPTTGAAGPQMLTLDLTGSTNFVSADAVLNMTADGMSAGVLMSESVDNAGYLTARYSNNQSFTYIVLALVHV